MLFQITIGSLVLAKKMSECKNTIPLHISPSWKWKALTSTLCPNQYMQTIICFLKICFHINHYVRPYGGQTFMHSSVVFALGKGEHVSLLLWCSPLVYMN
ncbi:hypothetical protein DCAR_0100591 [Daucus carota subsp. sativus]|uniref:Uncharacterized protein n=1 Tax=Daucus carota subsp. sativus TaxID=79200 RepID=A0A162A981_DAUCS|nr:hypothetical protein DCAR_0100591 [Daucus carota subsp. sativus]